MSFPMTATPAELEVIACTLEDALAAEEGGASRIELTVRLDQDGLTPPLELAREVVGRVHIPVRAMLRDRADFEVGSVDDLAKLTERALDFAGLGVEGLVTGYLSGQALDFEALEAILSAVPGVRFTAHRAVEHTRDPAASLRQLRRFANVDRALVSGGAGSLDDRLGRLADYREAFGAARRLIVGGGLTLDMLPRLREDPGLTVFHLGRAVRTPEHSDGKVDAAKVRRACQVLGIGDQGLGAEVAG
jgi:copper homeostasis protein